MLPPIRLRRTGRSTFLREDLRPALQGMGMGMLVIYVDLWEDRGADPGCVIVGAVCAALAKLKGIVSRLSRSSGTDKVMAGGLPFSLERVGLAMGVSLSAACSALSDKTGEVIVLLLGSGVDQTHQTKEAVPATQAARLMPRCANTSAIAPSAGADPGGRDQHQGNAA